MFEGKRPLNRPRGFQEEERRRKRQEKGERWYRREERGSKVREGIFIIPTTPGSLLAKAFKTICQEELRGTKISMALTEQGGRRLGQEVGCTVPGKSEKERCKRETCFSPATPGNLDGVRIAHLDPDTRMNSKDEFIFGACSRSGIVKCSVGEEKVAAEGLMQPVLLSHVVPSSQHQIGQNHPGHHHHIQPVLLS